MTDASDNVPIEIICQYDNDRLLHPLTFFSFKHFLQKINYEIEDKELLAIMKLFKEWRFMLKKTELLMNILTYYKNLMFFMSIKQLSYYQTCLSEFFSRFNFVIQYQLKKFRAKPNALTKRSRNMPKERNSHLSQAISMVFKSYNLDLIVKKDFIAAFLQIEKIKNSENKENLTLKELIDHSYEADFLPSYRL